MRDRIVTVCILLCTALAVSPSSNAQITALPETFDAYVDSVRAAFDVPGIAIAVVKDGKVLLAKGYGVRTLGSPAKVDGRTLFGIASNTKAFTAAAIALLVEEGKLEWDTPVIRYLPWFQLADPFVTSQLTIRDLLVHRSGLGLGGGDLLLWPPSEYDRKEIVARLRSVPLRTSFRSAYAYDNVLYLAAGEVIAAVSGTSWEEFVSTHIFARLGMTSSTVRYADAIVKDDVATPHAKLNGILQTVKPATNDNTNPAGGINSCADDMAKWMLCQLDSGRIADGTRLFSPRTTRQLWSIVTPIPISEPPKALSALKANFNGYALGFGVRDYRGKKLVNHTGGLTGYVSKVSMIPELKLGIAVLTNQESDAAFSAISYTVLDHFLGAPKTDWVAAYEAVLARTDSSNRAEERSADVKRDAQSHPSLPVEKYAGTYTDAWYGPIAIELRGGSLHMQFTHTPTLHGVLEHFQYDTFIVRWDDRELRADAYITFSLHPDGSIDEAKMKAVSPATDFSYDFQDLLLKPASGK